MIVFPAIDLRGGKVVRLLEGKLEHQSQSVLLQSYLLLEQFLNRRGEEEGYLSCLAIVSVCSFFFFLSLIDEGD